MSDQTFDAPTGLSQPSNVSEATLEVLTQFVPLSALPIKHVKDIAMHSKLIKLKPKSLLFKRGVHLRRQYYLVSGSVDICDDDFNIKSVTSTPSAVSPFALNSSSPTQSAAITTSPCTVLMVDLDRLDIVLAWSEAGNYIVEDIVENEETTEDWMSDLLQSHLFQKVPPSNIQQLFTSFKHEGFRQGHHVITQGDTGENFYVLQQGTAQVLRTDNAGQETELAVLTAGKFFGEEALISNSTRNATVKMLTDGACMRLDKATFNTLLKEPVLNMVTSRKANQLMTQDPKIRMLDLRSSDEAEAEPLPDALHIPLAELRQKMQELDTELTYITHAINGRRAELGAYLLNDAGFEAMVMK